MKHIHITLIGSQVYPAYLGIADLKPDGVIIVHSSSNEKEASLLEAQITIPSTRLVLDPVDVLKVYQQVRSLRGQIDESDQYSINLTGGTKVWSIAFYESFRFLPNVKLIYVDQNNQIYDLLTQECHLSNVLIDINTVFKLNGVQVTKSVAFSDYTLEDEACISKIHSLRRWSYESFRDLTCLDDKSQNKLTKKEGYHSDGLNYVEWNKGLNNLQVHLYNKNGVEKRVNFSAPHIHSLFFNYAWFEYQVAIMLSKWEKAQEILMNVRFPYKGRNIPKNEIDIIVNTGNKLLFVECKTQISDITDIDKFRTAVKNYGGMSSKAVFITLDKMKDTAKEKCTDSNIMSFSIKDCTIETPETPERELIRMLDQELFSINKK